MAFGFMDAGMSAAIRLEISELPSAETVHRFRNLGEEIYRQLWDKCRVDLTAIDEATTSFTVRDIRTRDLGAVTQLIKKQLKHHHFEKSAKMVRL
jgi:hypothetical protein